MAKKKTLMTFVWRISQTGPLLSLFFWSTALAGIFWPIVGREQPPGPLWWFVREVLGVSADRATVVGLLVLFLSFAAIILVIGFLYDRVLKLWREQMEIVYERNPYTDDLMFTKEVRQFEQYYLPLAKAIYKISPDPELKLAIERVERWIATKRIEPTQSR